MIDDKNLVADPTTLESPAEPVGEQIQTETQAVYTPEVSTDAITEVTPDASTETTTLFAADAKVASDSIESDRESTGTEKNLQQDNFPGHLLFQEVDLHKIKNNMLSE